MMGTTRIRAIYRWALLLFTATVWVWCFREARLAEFGWQFRLLEVWAATAGAISAVLVLRVVLGWSRSRHAAFVGAVAALNAVVIALHLGPLGVLAPPDPRWHALSLHLVLPLSQIADALLVVRAFGRLRGAVAWALGIAVGYVAWLELAVRPLNASAEGLGGLPYPPLDAMSSSDRLGVYAAVTAFGLAVLPGLWVLQRALRGEGAGVGGGGIAA